MLERNKSWNPYPRTIFRSLWEEQRFKKKKKKTSLVLVQECSSWKYITISQRFSTALYSQRAGQAMTRNLVKENKAESWPLSPHQSHPNHHPISSLRLFKQGGWRRDESQGQKMMGEDRQIFWISGSQTWLPVGGTCRALNILMPESYPQNSDFNGVWYCLSIRIL